MPRPYAIQIKTHLSTMVTRYTKIYESFEYVNSAYANAIKHDDILACEYAYFILLQFCKYKRSNLNLPYSAYNILQRLTGGSSHFSLKTW